MKERWKGITGNQEKIEDKGKGGKLGIMEYSVSRIALLATIQTCPP